MNLPLVDLHDFMSTMQKKPQEQRIKELQEQGLGVPVRSYVLDGHRFVHVGDKVMRSKKKFHWNTFQDFLRSYINDVLFCKGGWYRNEQNKPLTEKHPILQWLENDIKNNNDISTAIQNEPGIYSKPMIGSSRSLLRLAWNLFLIAHNNVNIQSRLLKRLKTPDSFHGAYYEIHVAAMLIQAGFHVKLEYDQSKSHYDITATSKITGKLYSVEAKTKAVAGVLGKVADKEVKFKSSAEDPTIIAQLKKALKQTAQYPRMIFIDMNVSPDLIDEKYIRKAIDSIKTYELSQIDSEKLKQAYVLVTNHPSHYVTQTNDMQIAVGVSGYNINDLPFGTPPPDSDNQKIKKSFETHKDLVRLVQSMTTHYEMPTRF